MGTRLHTHTEIPMLTQDENGSVLSGSIDLLVESIDGFWIVDHKSDQSDDLHGLFAFYRPQLECYGKAVTSIFPDKELKGIAINWITHGKASLMSK